MNFSATSARPPVAATWLANSITSARSFGEFLTIVSSDNIAVCGNSKAMAASTMIRWAEELPASLFKTCSAMAIASAGFLPNVIFAFAICGDEPAPLIIFLKKPLFATAAFRAWTERNVLRHSKNPGSFSSTWQHSARA